MNFVLLSQIFHLIAFESSTRRNQLETGALVISVDVDVGSKLLGEKNEFCDKTIHNSIRESKIGEIEELAIPHLVKLSDDLAVPMTFAMRGQLTEINESVIDLIKSRKIEHDIGAHGYTHKCFTDLSASEAEDEFVKISKGMKRFNVKPKSFVFPKNRIAHLSLLEKYGYRSYRGNAGFKYDTLNVEKNGQLCNVHPSFFLGRRPRPSLVNRIIDIAIKRKLPCHLWFHPWDLGLNELEIQTRIEKLLLPILGYAKKKEKAGVLSFETMTSIVDRFDEANN